MLSQRFLKAVQQQTIEFFWLCNKYLAVLSPQYNTTSIDFIQFSAFLPMGSMAGGFWVIPLDFKKENINRFYGTASC
ncbi:hypothetical protein [Bilophila sp.]|uniref:hypothetical protein n=1 Tax=Bilophila sp. TaxID=1929485 RepID=UPI0030772C86